MNAENTVEITPELLEQNPLLAFSVAAMLALAIAIISGSLASWIYLVIRARRGEPWLSVQPRIPRAWGLADLVVVAILVVACQSLFFSLYVRLSGVNINNLSGKPLPAEVSTLVSCGNLLAIGLTLAWLALRFQVSPAHVGFRMSGWWKQVQIACIAALASMPIVYLLMAAVSIGFDAQYKHPLLDDIRAQATFGSYLLGVITAVLIAPLVEEFLFRVMIQGWLQSCPFSSIKGILLGESPSERVRNFLSSLVPATEVTIESDGQVDSAAEGSLPPVVADVQAEPNPITWPANFDESELAVVPPVWPAVVTGILFGLAHLGYGLSFIPLIGLGIVLGLIYRATNSIWPCVLIHMALNGTSMLGLGLTILIERAQIIAFSLFPPL